MNYTITDPNEQKFPCWICKGTEWKPSPGLTEDSRAYVCQGCGYVLMFQAVPEVPLPVKDTKNAD